MSVVKLVGGLVIAGIVGVCGYDGVQIANAHRDVSNTASAAASAAAQAIASSKDRSKAKAAADAIAKAHGDVVTDFNYDAVTTKVDISVSGKASSLVLHWFDKNLTQDITARASARP